MPDGLRVYVIGDIHGRADLLQEIQARIERDARDHKDEVVVIYLGDFVDRGPDSRGTIDAVLTWSPPGFQRIALKGNHEEALLDFLAAPQANSAWLRWGGIETLMSYGLRPSGPQIDEEELQTLAGKLTKTMPGSHISFLSGLHAFAEFGDYFFAHAGVDPDRPLEDQADADLLWIREPFLSAKRFLGKVIVHGHTVVPRPENHQNRINIDTGAYATGILTCLVLQGTEQRFLQTGHDNARDWAAEPA